MTKARNLQGLVASRDVLGAGLGQVMVLKQGFVLLRQSPPLMESLYGRYDGLPAEAMTLQGIEDFARERSRRGPIAYLNIREDTSRGFRLETAAWHDGELVFGPERASSGPDFAEHGIIAEALRSVGAKGADGVGPYLALDLEKHRLLPNIGNYNLY